MLDVVFAIAVLGAVIFFGALISVGNERQRKAIDGIREQASRWAEQDLRLKRAHAMREVRVPDAHQWLSGVTARLLGTPPRLLSLTSWEDNGFKAIVAPCEDGRKLVVTSALPAQFVKAVQVHGRGRLQKAEVGLLGDRPKRVPVQEMNIVTCGPFFDLEAKLAWLAVTGSSLEAERLYLFEVPPVKPRTSGVNRMK
ncbi:MAG: hypothetical protein ABSB41_02220 [Anaerolineales bacterium]|jgi:hypothetical protein